MAAMQPAVTNLSHRERSDCIARCNPGEGLMSIVRVDPLTRIACAIRPLPAGERCRKAWLKLSETASGRGSSGVAERGDDVVDHFLDQDAIVALAHHADHRLGAGGA